MIEPTLIPLPTDEQDFGRHRTGEQQKLKNKELVCIPLLQQAEQMLNFIDHINILNIEVGQPRERTPNNVAHFKNGSWNLSH